MCHRASPPITEPRPQQSLPTKKSVATKQAPRFKGRCASGCARHGARRLMRGRSLTSAPAPRCRSTCCSARFMTARAVTTLRRGAIQPMRRWGERTSHRRRRHTRPTAGPCTKCRRWRDGNSLALHRTRRTIASGIRTACPFGENASFVLNGNCSILGMSMSGTHVSGCIRIPDIADRSLWTENRSYDKIIRQFIRSYDINPF